MMTEAQTGPLMCAWIGGWVTAPVIGAAGKRGPPGGILRLTCLGSPLIAFFLPCQTTNRGVLLLDSYS